jgi:two-component sensor histidine kinase
MDGGSIRFGGGRSLHGERSSGSGSDRPGGGDVRLAGAIDRLPILIRGLRRAGFCVMYHDASLRVRLIENPFLDWPSPQRILEEGDRAIFDERTAGAIGAAKRRVLSSGQAERVEARLHSPDGVKWHALEIEADIGGDGHAKGLFVTISDITEMKRREETLRQLLSEVSHRSRNLLAVVQGILKLTGRMKVEPSEFARKFRGRIDSLARTQDLVTSSDWRGARFRPLVACQLAPWVEGRRVALEVEGVDAEMAPAAAMHLGLALHELAANSAAYGVIRAGAGRLRVALEPQAEGLRFHWHETLERAAAPAPESEGFGTAVLQRALPRAVLGEARYEVGPREVLYSLNIPASVIV